jgi:N-acetylglucosaminyldiphosphoundecaprenol N-acetyl-beta-D-mannosaminyltransferase
MIIKNNILTFNKIKFYNYSCVKVISKLKKDKGYLVAPAASALTDINKNKIYHNALIKSSVAIFDSGLFCICLRIFKKISVKKLSGYYFFKFFINQDSEKKNKILTVDPSLIDARLNKKLLNSHNFIYVKNYIAPIYNVEKISDTRLIKLIKSYKPKYIFINIGGGIQEPLALYIKQYAPNVIQFCTGAAIAFFTGRQAKINDLVDSLYLGWLWRIMYNPRVYFIRIIKSLKLIRFFFENSTSQKKNKKKKTLKNLY